MKFKPYLAAALAAVIAFTPFGAPVMAQTTATLLPPGKQCFQATAGVNGMVGTIGTITGGSSYVAGTYGGVPLTGGSGTGATANITVAGGAVTAVTVLNPGVQYVVGDVLSASAATIGGAGSGFSVPIASTSINSSLAGGSVAYYVPSTLTTKQTWQNSMGSVLNSNPVPLDANGCAIVYGSGSYRQILKDNLGNTVWDAVTASTGGSGSSSGPTLIGDGAPVGTVWAWPGLALPSSNWMYAYGQSLSRVTYAALFNAITMTQNAVCSSGSTTLAGLADTTQINIDATIEGPCIPPGTFVVSRSASSVVMSNPATASATASIRFFPFGGGDGATTFSIPDYRGFAIIGRNNMGGSATSRITSTYFANDPNSLNAAGGSQSTTLATGNLPTFTPSGTITNGGITITNGAITNGAITINNGASVLISGPTTFAAAAGALSTQLATLTASQAPTTQATSTASQAASTFAGNPIGSTTPFSTIQPSITSNYIIKVLPDTNGLFVTGGLIPLSPVALATTTILPNSPVYNNGTFGVGATLTAGINGALAMDGVTVPFGARVMVKDQVAQAQNGIFVVSAVGDGSNPYVLTRAADFNSSSNMVVKSYVLVTGGNANDGSSFALQNSVTTVGTDPVVFVQIAEANGTFTQVGTGAITQTVQQKLQEHVSIIDFGAVAGGPAGTNLASIQNAVNQVVAHGGCLYIPGNGVRAYTIPANSSITIPASTTTFSICGDGPGSSILSFSGPSTTPLISVGAFTANLVIDGIQLTGNQTLPPTDTSTGIALGANNTVININNVNIRFFNTGISASSSFVIGINNSFITNNNQGVTLSLVNAVNLYHTTIGANYVYGASCTNCAQFDLYGGTIEQNGTNAGGTSSWGIKCNDCGTQGTVGVNVFGTYFEQNGGQADVWITQTTLSTAHSIIGSNFTRLSNTQFTTNNILVDGAAASQVTIQGDSFWGTNTYVANAARQYINLSTTGITASISNVSYSSATESAKFSREWNYRTGVGANGGMGFSDQSSVEIGKIVVDGSDNLLLAKTAGGGTFQISSNSGLLLNNVSFPLGAGSANTVPVVTAPNTITYQTVPNAALSNSTISGIALGSNLGALTFGTHLTSGGASYNGSAGVTITSDATSANTASTIVARDGSGGFSAGAGSFTTVAASGANNGLMAANSVKCNNTGAPATSIDCTVAQAQTLIIPTSLYSRSTFSVAGVNFNSANTDNQINITFPTGAVAYRVAGMFIGNASASISTATFGVFSSTGGGGTPLQAAGTAITVTTSAANTNNNGFTSALTGSNTTFYNFTSIQFRVGAAAGSPATADVMLAVDWIY